MSLDLTKFGGEDQEMEKEINAAAWGLIEVLSSSDDLRRTRACKSLIAMGEAAVPLLTEALKNSDDLARWEAAKALSEIGDPAAAPALVQALEDEQLEVRWRAAEGLIRMDVAGLRPLLEALVKDADSVLLRDGAHRVLHRLVRGELRDCLVPVLTALESTWPAVEVPQSALSALERLEELEKMRGERVSPLKESIATRPNQPVDLGARSRARRYVKSLRYRTP